MPSTVRASSAGPTSGEASGSTGAVGGRRPRSRAPAAPRSAAKSSSGSASLRTQPRAPASMARRADGASENALRTRTAGAGAQASRSRISATASMPGIEKSWRTTSGCRVRVSSSASAGSPTAPISSQYGFASSSRLSPSRTGSLSSTISVRTRGGAGADVPSSPAACRRALSGLPATRPGWQAPGGPHNRRWS